ncbi:MAG: DUF2255 family protein [Myxococcota bacterium]|jgi:hypothetical protein|nr:DUF2255 family protein [Myxococcota bacterium]
MKTIRNLVILLVGAIAAFYALVILASESDEVVTLRTGSGSGVNETRLWLVDYGDAEWVRTGHPEKGWFREVAADPNVELERAGKKSLRVAVPVHEPAVSQKVNEVFRAKYGHADWIVALSGDAADRIVVRLDLRE